MPISTSITMQPVIFSKYWVVFYWLSSQRSQVDLPDLPGTLSPTKMISMGSVCDSIHNLVHLSIPITHCWLRIIRLVLSLSLESVFTLLRSPVLFKSVIGTARSLRSFIWHLSGQYFYLLMSSISEAVHFLQPYIVLSFSSLSQNAAYSEEHKEARISERSTARL